MSGVPASGNATGIKPNYGEGREALLQAAVAVIGESGLRGLTIREVARVAGVSHGLVVHHFGKREALITEALDYAVDIGSNTIQFASGNIDEFASDLGGLVKETEGLQAFQIELIMEARRQPTLGPSVRTMYDRYISVIQSSLENVGLPEEPILARLLMAAVDGLVIQQLVYDRSDFTDQAVELLRKIILDQTERSKSSDQPS